MSKIVTIWILDAGREAFLAVSLGSLRLNAPSFWSQYPKVILDCGLSDPFRAWLMDLEPEGVHVVPAPHPRRGEHEPAGIGPMRQRVNLSAIATAMPEIEPEDRVLSSDPDTVFLGEPDGFPFPDGEIDIAVMPGHSIYAGREVETQWLSPATLAHPGLGHADLGHIAGQLGMSISEMRSVKSYNTGVFGFRAARVLNGPWAEAYNALREMVDLRGRPVFVPFMVEQNALSLCISRGQIRAVDLQRRFNCFPPIQPQSAIWPKDTVIAHFVCFHGRYRHLAYGLWFKTAERLMALGLMPSDMCVPAYLRGACKERQCMADPCRLAGETQ